MNAMSLGPYTYFIATSYALVTVVVVVLIIWIAIDYRRQIQILRDLEARGIARRSGRGAADIR
jgi:heme exporter protein D